MRCIVSALNRDGDLSGTGQASRIPHGVSEGVGQRVAAGAECLYGSVVVINGVSEVAVCGDVDRAVGAADERSHITAGASDHAGGDACDCFRVSRIRVGIIRQDVSGWIGPGRAIAHSACFHGSSRVRDGSGRIVDGGDAHRSRSVIAREGGGAARAGGRRVACHAVGRRGAAGLVPSLEAKRRRFSILGAGDVANVCAGRNQQGIGAADRAEVGPVGTIGRVLPGAAAGDAGDGHAADGAGVDIGPAHAAEDGRGERAAGGGIFGGRGERMGGCIGDRRGVVDAGNDDLPAGVIGGEGRGAAGAGGSRVACHAVGRSRTAGLIPALVGEGGRFAVLGRDVTNLGS